MRIFLTGVGCVGKTTIGAELAALLGMPFFDADKEIEERLGVHIGGLSVREAAEEVRAAVEDYLRKAEDVR